MLYFQGFPWCILKVQCTITSTLSTVSTHCQEAQPFDSVPGRTTKNPVCFSTTSPCLCFWRRKLPVSLLIRCYKLKTLLFTTVFLEAYFNRCGEAVKLNERRMLGTTGEKIPSVLRCRVCCTMTFRCSNKPQMWKTWPQVKTWWVIVRWGLCTQKTPTFSIYSTQKHLPFCLVIPCKISAGHPFYFTNPSRKGFPGEHSQGVGTCSSSLQVGTW